MTIGHEPGETLEPGVLVAWLDDALDERDGDDIRAHVRECPACQARARSLEATSGRVTRALEAADFEPPARMESRRVLQAVRRPRREPAARGLARAAGLILAITAVGALASAPVRAWIGERLDALRTADGETTVVADPADRAGRAGAALRFTPTSRTLDVVFEARQAAGTLEVRFAGGPGADSTASVTVTGGGTERLTVGRGLRIANAGSGASYALYVPPTVARVTVRVGDEANVFLGRDTIGGAPVEIGLATGRVRNPAAGDEG